MTELAAALDRYYRRNQRWGFLWALWTAVLWGVWYVPSTALWLEWPFRDYAEAASSLRLSAIAVMTWIHAIAVFGFLWLWNASLGKVTDFARTLVRFSTLSKWYALASLFGGPLAIFGSYMAMSYVGPVFAAVTSLFYPVVGAVIARCWLKEKISRRMALGMGVIILGGAAIYLPDLGAEMLAQGHERWLGYLGGLMSALGWGAEGAVAARAMDVSDPDVGIQCRFSFEILFWGLLILPALGVMSEFPVVAFLGQVMQSPKALLWIVIASGCHAYCYTGFYRSFSLIGVGRGEAVGNLYALFALVFIALFTLVMPPWYFLLGALLAIAGSLIMFSEPAAAVSQLRATSSPLYGETP
ncbi:MAG: DMT family transporter [Zoogloea sp.]|uniref:DMT family transporter n=1 Tax=Zoogloea sp. TaxID=49181 RepID=UPI003F2E55DF